MLTEFSQSVEDGGLFFGQFKTKTFINKKKCEIQVRKKLYFLERSWEIDVCREPIHIKEHAWWNLNVYKRSQICSNHSKTDYCLSLKRLLALMQDKVLVFSPGESEDSSSIYGKNHCAYELLKSYLEEGQIFSTKKMEVPIRPFSKTPIFSPEEKEDQENKKVDIPTTSEEVEPKEIEPPTVQEVQEAQETPQEPSF